MATSAMSLPDLMTWGVIHEVLGTCMLLNSTEKPPSMLLQKLEKECFLLKCFLLPVALERADNGAAT